jgi:hypothetical protein
MSGESHRVGENPMNLRNPKRQRTATLQNLAEIPERLAVRQSSAALDCPQMV